MDHNANHCVIVSLNQFNTIGNAVLILINVNVLNMGKQIYTNSMIHFLVHVKFLSIIIKLLN